MSIEPTLATVSVVDPDPSDRLSLEPLITRCGWRAKFFTCAAELLAAPSAPAPGCLLLDLHLPGMGSLELHSLLTRRHELSIIFTTDRIDIPAIVSAMKAGAVDVLTKPLHEEAVANTIAAALERSRQRMRHQAQLEQIRERYATLSSRERQVMALVVSGWMNKQVSGRLNISVITVKAHRGRMMRKMGASSLAQLVHDANALNIARVPPRRGSTNIPVGLSLEGQMHPCL
jgi:FixJ family two-component response regulator